MSERRPWFLTGCLSPVQEKYSRIHVQKKGHLRLRRIIRKIVSESKSLYGSGKVLSFQYDAVSYSHNFDEGRHRDDDDYAPSPLRFATRF